MNKFNSTIFITLALSFLSGCAKEPPKCSDKNTYALVQQIIIEQIGGREGISDKELEDNMKIEFPRASAYLEEIKKYSCEAKLTVPGAIELPITYESQLDDNNQHIVTVGGIAQGDLLTLKYAISEGIKKGRASKADLASPSIEPDVKMENSQDADKKMMGGAIDENPNAKPNGEEEAQNKKLMKPWQDENGLIHYPDGSISDGPVD